MVDKSESWESVGTALNVIGMAACVAGVLATGGLAALAGCVAIACLAGSFLASIAPDDTPCERYLEQSSNAAAVAVASPEPAISPTPEAETGHRWRQSVESSRTALRRR